MNSSVPAIEFENISKTYGNTQALRNFSLTVEKGDFLGLMGPNGAGKTTAVHLATGLATIQEGTISIHGHDVQKNYQEARKRIGLAPQEANFDRFFSAIDCLTYQGGYFGIPSQESRDRALELLELFGLTDKKNQRPTELSGGQKRRLLIAKALVHDPDVLILDEPTASLDVELRRRLWEYLRELKDRGKTIVLTTHYIEEVEALTNTVAILDDGSLLLAENTNELLQQHGRNQYIFEFERLPAEAAELIESRFDFVEADGKVLRANVQSFGPELDQLMDIIYDEELEFEGLRYHETELEEIFMERVYDND